MKRFPLLLIILLVLIASLFALSVEDIYYADSQALRNMAAIRGLDTSLNDNALRNALYDYEDLERYEESVEDGDDYTLSINSADYLSSSGDIITLRGNVSISFIHDGEETVLESDEVVIDSESSLFSALGNVSFSTEGESGMERIDADIVTFYWQKGNIVVENASTLNVRENSEGESVNVYSVGERLTYFESGAAVYDDGYIASSDDDPLSSISASRITMLPGSDMLIEHAVLNIGRVPLF